MNFEHRNNSFVFEDGRKDVFATANACEGLSILFFLRGCFEMAGAMGGTAGDAPEKTAVSHARCVLYHGASLRYLCSCRKLRELERGITLLAQLPKNI